MCKVGVIPVISFRKSLKILDTHKHLKVCIVTYIRNLIEIEEWLSNAHIWYGGRYFQNQ